MVHEGPASSDAKGSRWGRVELLVLVGSRSSGHLNTVHKGLEVCSGLQWSAAYNVFYDVL